MGYCLKGDRMEIKKIYGKTRNCRGVDKTLQGTTKIYGITCERRQNGDKKVYEKIKED